MGEECWQPEPTLPLQANEWQSVCYSGNHSFRALLSPSQINEVSHSLELLILFRILQNKIVTCFKNMCFLHYNFLIRIFVYNL